MNLFRQTWRVMVALLLLTGAATAADTLKWNAKTDRVDADIKQWNLPTLLNKISTATGWEVYLEPGARHDVSTRFTRLPSGEALPKLLGKLNYALLPGTNSAPRLYVFQTSAGNATLRIGAAEEPAPASTTESKHLIANELVVTLDPDSGLTIEELAKMLGAKIVGRATELNSYLLRFENETEAAAAREKLKGYEGVASVDSNYRFDPPPPSFTADGGMPSFNIKATGATDSSQLVIGLIDSAVQTLDPAMQAFLLAQLSTGEKANLNGPLSHGTSMAQAMLQAMALATEGGVSKVKILPVDVYGNRQNTTTFDVAYGIYLAVNNGSMIVNLSLGSSGDSPFLRKVIRDARAQGVLFFASAGNEPVTTPTFPAAYPEVVAVTAGDRSRNLAAYANRGSFVDVIGPGGTIVRHGNNSYFVGGTSVASAYVAGTAGGTAGSTQQQLSDIELMIRRSLAFQPAP